MTNSSEYKDFLKRMGRYTNSKRRTMQAENSKMSELLQKVQKCEILEEYEEVSKEIDTHFKSKRRVRCSYYPQK